MAQAPRFAVSLGIILVAVVIAVAITTWAHSPKEVIYQPQYQLVY